MKLFVIGKPINHSKSPIMHNHWLERYNLSYTYKKKKIDEKELVSIIDQMRIGNIKGINVTLPYKEKIIKFMDELDESAKTCGAVNTIYKNKKKIIGANTDGKGFIESLQKDKNFSLEGKNYVIIGSGGASLGIIAELAKYKVKKIQICNRTKEKAEKIFNLFNSKKFPIEIIEWGNILPSKDTDIVINTSSFGMNHDECINIDFSCLKKKTLFYDIIYNPTETKLLKKAKKKGFQTINGIDMLLRQASISFKLWFGIEINKSNLISAKNKLIKND